MCHLLRWLPTLLPILCAAVTGGKTAGDRGSRTQPPDAGAARHPPGHGPGPGFLVTDGI